MYRKCLRLVPEACKYSSPCRQDSRGGAIATHSIGDVAIATHSNRTLSWSNLYRYSGGRHKYRHGRRHHGRNALLGGAAAVVGVASNNNNNSNNSADQPIEADLDPDDEEIDIDHAPNTRYRKTRMFSHFCSFSSIKYKDELYMTGDDFLQAILYKEKKTATKRFTDLVEVTDMEYERIIRKAPSHSKETRGLFRGLGKWAVISYPEYLFLVSILSKPRDHFLKTFQMIDIDGNWELTKDEFELVEQLFSKGVVEGIENTTLKVHFFNLDGHGIITFDDFVHFLDNLQKECLEVEFNEYAKGTPSIPDSDFMELLLSRTVLCDLEKDKYRARISNHEVCENHKGVSFGQYSQFMNLLNDIHDLEIALRMFQIAKKPVTPDEFQRAVRVCTGRPLDEKLIELTFTIFDEDGDGQLGHEEFMKVMKDRIRNRGTVDVQIPPNSWKAFKKCVHERMMVSSA